MKVIVIEGVDGTGKQTQATKLFEKLKNEGADVHMISLPNYQSPSAAPVKMYLGGEIVPNANDLDAYSASLLFTVDRICTITQERKKWNKNSIIIFDRYTTSNLLHQASKIQDEQEQKKYISWLYNLEFNILKLPFPSQVYFLNITPQQSEQLRVNRANKNCKSKDIHECDKTYLERSYFSGIKIAKEMNWEIINCIKDDKLRSIEDIHLEILSKLKI